MTGNAAFTVSRALNYSSTGSTTLKAATPISIGTFDQSAGTLVDNGNTIHGDGNRRGHMGGIGHFHDDGHDDVHGLFTQIGASNFNNLTINVGSGNTATLTGNAIVAGNLTLQGDVFS